MQSENTNVLRTSSSYRASPASRAALTAVAATAFAVLVARYSGESEVIIALSDELDDRDAQTQVLRLSVEGDHTLPEVQARVRELLSTTRPIHGPRARLAWHAEDGRAMSLLVRLANLAVIDHASSQRGLLATRDEMRSIEGHLRAIARAFRDGDANVRVSDASLVDAKERARIELYQAGESAPLIARPELLHGIFERTAHALPDAVAVVDGARQVTYAELDALAERIANALATRGVGPGARVAMQLARSIEAYGSILGILKAGAAYVPLDPEWPAERMDALVSDCGATLRIDERSYPLLLASGERTGASTTPPRARPTTSDDIAYVIYTSGSTGTPKGVEVAHRSVAHFVRAEQRLFAIDASDRVLQGFSLAFDASVEELGLAFASGATLVVGPKHELLTDFAGFVTAMAVSVVSTVPTLLSSVDAPLPTVRLLIVGGESCPLALVERFASERCAMVNTYGPTEATVVATYAELRAGQPVTIGRPLPNYRVAIVDRFGNDAPVGVAGELLIGGPGVARGYLGRPELTASRFVSHDGARFYRTGDLGRFDDDGNIVFLGRADDQVKIRGFRVELGEVEAALIAAGASQAVCVVREQSLCAYAVLRDGVAPLDEASLVRALRRSLPAYMVPTRVVLLSRMPLLASGKVDKRALPTPQAATAPWHGDAPKSPQESAIAACFSRVLARDDIGRDDDFFYALGGHSLTAARVVSALRKQRGFEATSILDLYAHPTVAALAAHLASTAPAAESEMPRSDARRASPGAYAAASTAQALALYPLFGAHAAQWLGPLVAYSALRQAGGSPTAAALLAAAVLFGTPPLLLVLAALAKWSLIGRYVPGRHPLASAFSVRFWIVEKLFAIAPLNALVGTPLLPMYLRLLGARVGARVYVGTESLGAFDLLDIGDDVAIGADARLRAYAIEDGEIVLGRIALGSGATIGARAVVSDDVAIAADATLDDLSLAPRGTRIPRGEQWHGSPAVRRDLAPRSELPPPTRRARAAAVALLYALFALALPGIGIVPLAPAFALLHAVEDRIGAAYVAAAPIAGALYVVVLAAVIAGIKWLALGRVKAGRYPLDGGFMLRKWIFDRAMATSLDVLGSLYATLFLNPWYRLLGVKLGLRAEISTAGDVTPDLVHVDEDAFIADCVALGAPRVERGAMTLAPTRVGKRAFVGNSAVLGAGANVGDDALVGCLSVAPPGGAPKGAVYVGSPATALPVRERSPSFARETTYRPTRALVAKRLAIETVRVTLPTTVLIVIACAMVDATLAVAERFSAAIAALLFPLLYAATAVVACALVVALKWALIGKYRPSTKPLWSTFVWRTELVTAMHENVADALCGRLLTGSPFAAWLFRALGARIGRRVHMGTTQLTEYDLVAIGDDASLDEDCTLQTHLFEDRVMKMATVDIGARCSVGRDAIVLYDTSMQHGSRLGALSLLMKGEVLPPFSAWVGSPARAQPRGRA